MNRFSSSFLLFFEGPKLKGLAYLFLCLLSLCFFLPGFATLPPIDRDEPSFAQASKQMVESHDYVDIRLQKAARYKKPIGIYWLQAASVKFLNIDHLNEIWAYRLPSLLGATVSILMTATLGTLLFDGTTGLIAAIMMVGCTVLNGEARLAKTDAMLLATILISQYGLARAYLGTCTGWRIPLLFWSALSFGFLIKGPIPFLVLASTLTWLWYTDKNLSWFWRLKPWVGIPYSLLLIVPWFVAISLASHGEFMQQSAGHDLLAKLWQGQDRGVLLPGLHLLAFPIVFFPFSLLTMMALPDVWARRQEKAFRFCLGWIIPTWVVFELSLTKLPHYVMPTYPALSFVTARILLDGYPFLARQRRPWFLIAVLFLWILAGCFLALGFLALPYLIDGQVNESQILASFLLLLAMGATLFFLPRKDKTPIVGILALGSFIFMATTLGYTMPHVRNLWMSNQIVEAASKIAPCPQLKIAASYYNEPSLVFLAGTDTLLSLHAEDVAEAMQKDPCVIGVLDENRLSPFLKAFADGHITPHYQTAIRAYDLGHGGYRTLSLYTSSINSMDEHP